MRVVAVDGRVVRANPQGSFDVADVTVGNEAAVPVEIEATGIPPGTVVTLKVYPQSPVDNTIVNLPAVQVQLSGDLARSTATAHFTFPYGFSRGVLHAAWTQ